MSQKVRLNLSAVSRRGPAYETAVRAVGIVVGKCVEIAVADYLKLAGSKASKREPKPIEEWPLPFRLVARHRQPGESGIGDTAARWIGAVGGEQFKLWFRLVIGHDCRCADRQDWLNRRWPYSAESVSNRR